MVTATDTRMRRNRRADATYPDRQSQHNAARANTRANTVREFIGVDGEGVTENSVHSYVLLSVGSESLHRNGQPLTFLDVAPFLWEMYLSNPHAVYGGFYLSYDYTMWFKSLPEERARLLLTDEGAAKRARKMGRNPIPFPVYYDQWEMDIHAGKRFKLRPLNSKAPWLYVCDMGPFFQTSFLNAINPESWPVPICTASEYETIRQGKDDRNAAMFGPTMMRYNTLENDVLGRVAQTLDAGFTAMGVRLKRTQWYGPGQSAQVWLNHIGAPDRDDTAQIPAKMLEAFRCSYYGGWFEIMAHGHIPGVTYEYDINSAYPAVIADLPCLKHGNWVTRTMGQEPPKDALAVVFATVRQNPNSGLRIGTMPHRTKDGAILRPRATQGWYLWQEIRAAQRAGCIHEITVYQSYEWQQTCDHKPFAAIADLYHQRQEIGKDTPLGKALKLVYNSAYGKLAQSVGEPRYANPIYASLVTGGCRIMIWDAIATHPNGVRDVTMIATDGVYFRSPHPSLPISDKLGEWSCGEKRNLCQVMPGLYWDDTARQNARGKLRSRGISPGDLRRVIPALDSRWARWWDHRTADPARYRRLCALFGVDAVRGLQEKWPSADVPISFGLVSAKLALHRNAWDTCGTLDRTPRVLSSDPSDKRDPATAHEIGGVIWTMPYAIAPDGLQSTPYDKRFGLELRAKIVADDVITPDGHIDDELYELSRGEHQ